MGRSLLWKDVKPIKKAQTLQVYLGKGLVWGQGGRSLWEESRECIQEWDILHIVESWINTSQILFRNEICSYHRILDKYLATIINPLFRVIESWINTRSISSNLLFRVMDTNGDGFISKVEMLGSSPHLTKEYVDAVFRRNDGDGDGKLSKDEFKNMIRRNSREGNISRFDSTECVKSLSRSPLQERSRSTGGSCRIKTSRSSSAGMERRHSESPVQNVFKWNIFSSLVKLVSININNTQTF